MGGCRYAGHIEFGRPIIGILGGIGSGKSTIAQLFAEMGCLVIDSDAQVRQIYTDPGVRNTLKQWWGDGVLCVDGSINRAAVAAVIFQDPQQRRRLESLVHPLVNAAREQAMAAASNDPELKAFVWDTPLLTETGLDRLCDRLVFVETPLDARVQRVQASRGWNEVELLHRENSQDPLDKKRAVAHDVIVNTAGADDGVRDQVRSILLRILSSQRTGETQG